MESNRHMENLRTTAIALTLTALWLPGVGCAELRPAPVASPAQPSVRSGSADTSGAGGLPHGAREGAVQDISIMVTDRGFEPPSVTVVRDRPVTLSFHLVTSSACRRDILLRISPDVELRQHLVLHAPVRMTVSFPETGTIRITCEGSPKSGTIIVHDEP